MTEMDIDRTGRNVIYEEDDRAIRMTNVLKRTNRID